MKRHMAASDLARDERFVRLTLEHRLGDPRIAGRQDRGPDGRRSFDASRPGAPDQARVLMHGIFTGEIQALEGAGRTCFDFDTGKETDEVPFEMKLDMARQCWDEARHVQIYEKLLVHCGGTVGMFPESSFLFECACADDPALRVAGVNRGLEGLACDVFRDMIRFAEASGDETMRQAVDYVLADELTHVRFGSEWVKEFTKNDPARFEAAQEFRRQVDKQFSFGGSRSDREDAAIRIAREDRIEAGFTEQELDELTAISAGGPSRETLRKAAEALRIKHLARRAAEEKRT